MSIRLMSRVWDKDVSGNAQLVLLCLSDFANDDGVCWPSLDRIAWKIGVNERTVRRAIENLTEQGVLSKKRRFHSSTVYTLNLEALPDKPSFIQTGQIVQFGESEPDRDESQPDNDPESSGHSSESTGHQCPPNHHLEPPSQIINLEPPLSPKKNARGFEAEHLFTTLWDDIAIQQALRAGRVPISRYRDALDHAIAQALTHGARNPKAYVSKILLNYQQDPWYKETKEERLARGRTAVQPG